MATGYFDTTSDGFTLRVFYEERSGVLTITDMKLKSDTYARTWFPGGTIKINGQTVLQMSYSSPATHNWYFYSVPSDFVEMGVGSGVPLPVSSKKITSGKAEIEVDITLYRDSSTSARPKLQNVVTVNVLSGFCYVGDGANAEAHMIYVGNGSDWDQYIPYIGNGTSWDMCS